MDQCLDCGLATSRLQPRHRRALARRSCSVPWGNRHSCVMSMMLPIGRPRVRRSLSLVGVLMVAVSVLASCGGADKFELTLRARDDDGSSPVRVERHWLAADGRHATSPENSGTFPVDAVAELGNVECAGQRWLRVPFSVLGPELASRDDSFELKIDDGNRLMLDPQSAVTAGLGETSCFEETGRWQGTAGDLQNHAGTFNIHYDSIQTVLRLVED